MSWGEFVHVTARFFDAGAHPWTDEEFYLNSQVGEDGPITLTLFAHEGPRSAAANGWWEDGLWIVKPELDQDYCLIHSTIRFYCQPLQTGASESDAPMGLFAYLTESGEEIFAAELPNLIRIATRERKAGAIQVAFLTLWYCDAGRQYIPGEPDEYYQDWQLLGVVSPLTTGVKYEEIGLVLVGRP